jgi:hypothetical protein
MATRTENVSLEDLQNIVGEEHAREAAPEDAAGPRWLWATRRGSSA